RPRPGPVGINAEAGRVLGPPARELRAGLGPAPAVEPVAARGGAVVLEPGEAGELLARLDLLPGLRVFEVGQRLAVDLLGDLGERRMQRIGVGPGEVQDGIWELPAFLLIKLPYLEEDLRDDVLV